MKQELEEIKAAVDLARQALDSGEINNINNTGLIRFHLSIATDKIDEMLAEYSRKSKQPRPEDKEPIAAKLPFWRKVKNKIWSD